MQRIAKERKRFLRLESNFYRLFVAADRHVRPSKPMCIAFCMEKYLGCIPYRHCSNPLHISAGIEHN
jgi:hypothetical protein